MSLERIFHSRFHLLLILSSHPVLSSTPSIDRSFAEVVGRVEKAGAVKLTVTVEIFVEEMYGQGREKAVEGIFVFASLDENNRPIRISYPEEMVI